ncbi:hypothetical protein BH10PSE19_BH10PSE19_07510 [soil metagenome]
MSWRSASRVLARVSPAQLLVTPIKASISTSSLHSTPIPPPFAVRRRRSLVIDRQIPISVGLDMAHAIASSRTMISRPVLPRFVARSMSSRVTDRTSELTPLVWNTVLTSPHVAPEVPDVKSGASSSPIPLKTLQDLKIAISGIGNMAKAIMQGWTSMGITVVAHNRTESKIDSLDIKVINCTKASLEQAVLTQDIICLSTKPWIIKEQCEEIARIMTKHGIDPASKTIISFAAGIPTAAISAYTGCQKVVRVMANLAVANGNGITGIYFTDALSQEEQDQLSDLFARVGDILPTKNENALNLVTAVFGSGPGWICFYLEHAPKELNPRKITLSILKAAAQLGLEADFPAKKIQQLVEKMIESTKGLLKKDNLTPAELRKKVTTEGGTTHAIVTVLERAHNSESSAAADTLVSALLAGTARGKEMGEKFAPLAPRTAARVSSGSASVRAQPVMAETKDIFVPPPVGDAGIPHDTLLLKSSVVMPQCAQTLFARSSREPGTIARKDSWERVGVFCSRGKVPVVEKSAAATVTLSVTPVVNI